MNFKRIVAIVTGTLFLLLPIVVFATEINLNGNFNDWEDKPGVTDASGDESSSQDVVSLKWFPDNEKGTLYFYAERSGTSSVKGNNGNNKENGNGINSSSNRSSSAYDDREDSNYNDAVSDDDIYQDAHEHFGNLNLFFKFWYFSIDIDSEKGPRKLYVLYHPSSRMVVSILTDQTGGMERFLWDARGKWGEDKNTAERVEFFVPLSYLVSSANGGYELHFHFNSGSDRIPDSGNMVVSSISTFPWITAIILFALVTGMLLFLIRRKKNAIKGV